MRKIIVATFGLSLLLLSALAQAVLDIVITQNNDSARPIAIVPFAWNLATTEKPIEVASIIAADLARSGQFNVLAEDKVPAKPVSGQTIDFQHWRTVGADHLVVGELRKLAPDLYAIDVQLFDTVRGRQLLGHSYPTAVTNLRRTVHHVADALYEKITGIKGAFNTRLTFVSVVRSADQPPYYALQIADADGFNARTVVKSSKPILSPTWSPDGQKLAYVSFRHRRSEIYLLDLKTGKEQKLDGFAGINSAPAFSPDGQKLAMTLSRDGNPDIFSLEIGTGQLKQMTRSYAIETEPVWDGTDGIIFTSGRTGSPQLYHTSVKPGQPVQRLSFNGHYNASAALSPDRRYIAMVHGQHNKYRIALLDRSNQVFRVMTGGEQDDSPSFSPNGRMILYATKEAGRGVLAIVSIDGRARQKLLSSEGDIREPNWSPFSNY